MNKIAIGNALKHIKNCAVTISTLYVAMIPFVYLLEEKDDVPDLIIIGMVSIFAAVLQKLLTEYAD